jgi:2-dehydropantoate 2-reductase
VRTVIIGAGALGAYFGARLAAVGHTVTFVARGDHLTAIRRNGLRIESEVAPTLLRGIHAVGQLDGCPEADLVIVAVKLWDTISAAQTAKTVVGHETTVVSFQNGVDAMDDIGQIIGRDRVIGGIAYISASIAEPGVIRHNGKLQRLAIGERNRHKTPRTMSIEAAFQAAAVECEISDDIERALWEKFVFIVGLSAATCLFRRPIGSIRSHSQSRDLLHKLMAEAVTVGIAAGARLEPSYAENRLAFMDTLPQDMVASMFVDLQRGRRLELPWFSGKVASVGSRLGVPTPANSFVSAALSLDEGGAATDEFRRR